MSLDLETIINIVKSLPSGLQDSVTAQSIRDFVSKPTYTFDSLNCQTLVLAQLFAKLFSNPTEPRCYDLLLYATSKAHADIWFDLLVSRLQHTALTPEEMQLCLSLLSKFFLEYRRFPKLLTAIHSTSICIPTSNCHSFIANKMRRIVTLPTIINDSIKTAVTQKLFKPEVYFPFILKDAIDVNLPQLNCILISQACLQGFGSDIWNFILKQVSRLEETSRSWSVALSHIQERALESTLVPLLKKASHPHLVTICLSSALNSLMRNPILRLFNRLLLFRRFPPCVPINIFGFLKEVITDDLYILLEKDLGLHLLNCWADCSALSTNSSQNRIYLNQALVAWVCAFQDYIIKSPNYHDMVSSVLKGISVHLSSNIEEQKVLGMAVGEWLTEKFEIGKRRGDGGESTWLKFEYVENEAVRQVKPLFQPVPAYITPGNQANDDLKELFNQLPMPKTPTKSATPDLDSDDDLDEEEIEFSTKFPKLPEYLKPAPTGWPFRERRPHYLRECMDGLSGVQHESDDVASNEIALSCFAHAKELIYRHRGGAVDEVAVSFADILLHTEPPASPHIDEVNASRHDALVALVVTSPRRTARYLTGQLIQPSLGINQYHEIIAVLTNAAVELKENFTPIVGDFFFPMLRAADQLISRQPNVYSHLDDGILSRLVASLGSMYALASNSLALPRMAKELLALSEALLTPKRDPAVRRSILTALNVMLTASGPAVFAANHQIFLNSKFMNRLLNTLYDESDSECQKLAQSALGFLQKNVTEFIAEYFGGNMECDEPIEVTPGTSNLRSDLSAPPSSQPVVHAEVRLTRSSTASRETVCQAVETFLRAKSSTCSLPAQLESVDFGDSASSSRTFLQGNVTSIHLSTEDSDCQINRESAAVHLETAPLLCHVYRLVTGDEADPTHETLEVSNEVIRGGTRWALPSASFDGLWDSLVYDSTVKRDLLKYSESALLFGDCKVNQRLIAWNRVIFLHGPPGTGKTSLGRALAHKLSIRLSHSFSSAALIEINTVNLMSKWFSESARLVSQMFASIVEYVEDPDHLVFLLVDEVESLTAVRKSVASSCEPSDALRVVNAVLTHLDQLKYYPNVMVIATSNVTGVVDPAFLDRADIRAYIGPPSAVAIYSIYASCLNELIRVGLIERQKSGLLSYRVLSALQFVESPVTAPSLLVWRLSQRSVGLNGRTLRKLPLLAHAFHVDTSKYPTYVPARWSTISGSGDKENSTLQIPGGVMTTAGTGGRRFTVPAVPLEVFVEALQRAVDSRFSDQRLILQSTDESFIGGREKAVNAENPSSLVEVNLL
ncbi:hypothetical protein Aperf_G00000029539 [Anoplocephala perfoliata]